MSAKPILYYNYLSPPARAVLLTAAAVGVDLELKEVNLVDKENLSPEFIKVGKYNRTTIRCSIYINILFLLILLVESATHSSSPR